MKYSSNRISPHLPQSSVPKTPQLLPAYDNLLKFGWWQMKGVKYEILQLPERTPVDLLQGDLLLDPSTVYTKIRNLLKCTLPPPKKTKKKQVANKTVEGEGVNKWSFHFFGGAPL